MFAALLYIGIRCAFNISHQCCKCLLAIAAVQQTAKLRKYPSNAQSADAPLAKTPRGKSAEVSCHYFITTVKFSKSASEGGNPVLKNENA